MFLETEYSPCVPSSMSVVTTQLHVRMSPQCATNVDGVLLDCFMRCLDERCVLPGRLALFILCAAPLTPTPYISTTTYFAMKTTVPGLSGRPRNAVPGCTPTRRRAPTAGSPPTATPATPSPSQRRRYDFHQQPTELPQVPAPCASATTTNPQPSPPARGNGRVPGLSQPYVEDAPDEDDERYVHAVPEREVQSGEGQSGQGRRGHKDAHKVRMLDTFAN